MTNYQFEHFFNTISKNQKLLYTNLIFLYDTYESYLANNIVSSIDQNIIWQPEKDNNKLFKEFLIFFLKRNYSEPSLINDLFKSKQITKKYYPFINSKLHEILGYYSDYEAIKPYIDNKIIIPGNQYIKDHFSSNSYNYFIKIKDIYNSIITPSVALDIIENNLFLKQEKLDFLIDKIEKNNDFFKIFIKNRNNSILKNEQDISLNISTDEYLFSKTIDFIPNELKFKLLIQLVINNRNDLIPIFLQDKNNQSLLSKKIDLTTIKDIQNDDKYNDIINLISYIYLLHPDKEFDIYSLSVFTKQETHSLIINNNLTFINKESKNFIFNISNDLLNKIETTNYDIISDSSNFYLKNILLNSKNILLKYSLDEVIPIKKENKKLSI